MSTENTNDIVVTGATTVTGKKMLVTQKTLKAYADMNRRIVEDGLLEPKEAKELEELAKKIRTNWITKNL